MSNLKAILWFGSLGVVLIVGWVVSSWTPYDTYRVKTSDVDRERYEAAKGFLVEQVGEDALTFMEWADEQAFSHRLRKDEVKPRISDFEALDIPAAVLEELWSEGSGAYPRGWVWGEVFQIFYLNREKALGEGYGEIAGDRALGGSAGDGRIMFTNDAIPKDAGLEATLRNLDYFFGHEIAHQNDWDTERDMSLAERAEFLAKVLRSMEISTAPIRYVSRINLEDPQEERHLRAVEYWASISEKYFASPEWFKENYPREYELVDEQVKRSDPSFDPIKAKRLREQLIDQAMTKR